MKQQHTLDKQSPSFLVKNLTTKIERYQESMSRRGSLTRKNKPGNNLDLPPPPAAKGGKKLAVQYGKAPTVSQTPCLPNTSIDLRKNSVRTTKTSPNYSNFITIQNTKCNSRRTSLVAERTLDYKKDEAPYNKLNESCNFDDEELNEEHSHMTSHAKDSLLHSIREASQSRLSIGTDNT